MTSTSPTGPGDAPLTYTLPAAATRMGVKLAFLKGKIEAGEIAVTQIGARSYGFTEAQIEEALAALRVQPTSTPASLTTPRARKRAA